MSYQGIYGAFPFSVSDDEVATFKDLKRSRSIHFAEHKVLGSKGLVSSLVGSKGIPKLQHMGRELDTVSLQIVIFPMSPSLTVDARILILRTLAETGTALPLVIGLGYYGMYVATSVEVSHKIIHNGLTWCAYVDLSLKEYN